MFSDGRPTSCRTQNARADTAGSEQRERTAVSDHAEHLLHMLDLHTSNRTKRPAKAQAGCEHREQAALALLVVRTTTPGPDGLLSHTTGGARAEGTPHRGDAAHASIGGEGAPRMRSSHELCVGPGWCGRRSRALTMCSINGRTRNEGGNIDRRRLESEHDSEAEVPPDAFKDGWWDKWKIVTPFAFIGVVHEDYWKAETERVS